MIESGFETVGRQSGEDQYHEDKEIKNQKPICQLCEKSRLGTYRFSKKIILFAFGLSLACIIGGIFMVHIAEDFKNIFLGCLYLLFFFIFLWPARHLFVTHYEYWFIHENKPHAHLRLPEDTLGNIIVDNYLRVAIGGRGHTRLFLNKRLENYLFVLRYYQTQTNSLAGSGLELRDKAGNRLRFSFNRLPGLFQFIQQTVFQDNLSQAVLLNQSIYLEAQAKHQVCEDELQTHRVQNEALQQVILILVDRVTFYRRTLGNSKYGRFTDSFLRRAWLNIFDQPLDTGRQNQARYPGLHQMAIDSLAEIGIKEGYL